MIVVDTNVLSEFTKVPDPAVMRWWRSVHPAAIACTTITRAEARLGLELMPGGRRKDQVAEQLAEAFARIPPTRWLPFDGAAADRYAEIVVHRQRLGRPIGMADAQIAGIVHAHGATLATRNVRDFDDCGITVVDPFA